jgi:nucleoside-diphosphate-sugar epimerase
VVDSFWTPQFGQEVWLFGHTGYFGRHLLVRLWAEGHEVKGVSSADCDLTDAEAVRYFLPKDMSGACVIMAAAVPRKKGDTEANYKKNIAMAENVLAAAVALDEPPENMVLFSSADVYGDEMSASLNEDAPLNPKGPYARYKAEAEALYRKTCREHRISLAILRTPGIHGGHVDDQSLYATFEARFLAGEKITVTNNGMTLRSFLSIELLEEVVCELVSSSFEGTLNVANPVPTSIREVAGLSVKHAGMGQYVLGSTISDRDYHMVLDVSRTQEF